MKESERRNQNPLTIKAVAERAKEVLFKHGEHASTLIAEGDLETIIVALDMPDTSEARQQYLFMNGMLLAMNGEIGVLQQAFFITEGWMSIAQPGETLTQRASEDPQRLEVLLISNMKLYPPSTQLSIIQMIREGDMLTDLREHVPPTRPDTQVKDHLLEAFVAGYRTFDQRRD